MSQFPFLSYNQSTGTTEEQTSENSNEKLYTVRSAPPGELGDNYVYLWNKPGGAQAGAVIVSRLANRSQVTVYWQDDSQEWTFVKFAQNTSYKGWCQTGQIFEE